MEITNVVLELINNPKEQIINSENEVTKIIPKAICRIVINDMLVLTGLRILDINGKLEIAFPSIKNENGKYKDVFFPQKKEAYDLIRKAIIDEYLKKINSIWWNS